MQLFPEITDWRINPAAPELSVFFKGKRPLPVNGDDAAMSTALELSQAIQVVLKSEEGKHWKGRFNVEVNERRHRVELMPNGNFALRVIPERVPTMEELNIEYKYRQIFLNPNLSTRGGLVIVGGHAGSGKSTTVNAALCDRLKLFGGYGITYENPKEFEAQGFHGEGYLDQNSVSQESMAEALRGSMRCLPVGNAIIFVGEIIDLETAHEVFRIMMNGHLILTTGHGGGIIEIIARFCSLLDAENNKAALEMLAVNLRWVIHQEFTESREVRMRALEITQPASSLIAQGYLNNLKDEIQRTDSRLNGGRG